MDSNNTSCTRSKSPISCQPGFFLKKERKELFFINKFMADKVFCVNELETGVHLFYLCDKKINTKCQLLVV